ncbi:oxidoreductase [Arthrobacter alpinus]|uniref:Oxidoreductase n=1 Tax=Arthrobacter alpinus TaxID=656366 RepID=A0A0M4QXG9_9MICC|nr:MULTISPECIES: aldo/keto reductase [Arthrobacter]ALE92861.1 oxidoreductase [Arthrobacter alpinus]
MGRHAKTNTVTLNNGVIMPQLGFGVWQVPNAESATAATAALNAGYRSIDTAAVYGNEEGVGQAVAGFLAATGTPRAELFITTKLWNTEQGYERTFAAFQESLDKLGLDYVDLYLIHWSTPEKDTYLDTWRAFEEIYASGKAKAIGVSNFEPEHLARIIELGGTVPAVNQVELHPRLQQAVLREFNTAHGIHTEAWSPLAQGQLLTDPAVTGIADVHGKSAAQVIIRWHLQLGNIVIPKSVTPERIAANFDVFDFELSDAQMEAIGALENNGRVGPHPNEFN